jgi:ActD protein
MTNTWCLAKFNEPTRARAAVRRLLQSGIDPDRMDVMSSQPIHGEPFLPNQKPTKLRTWALIGAGLGLVTGVSLASFTALAYPLVKGGMPIVAPWTVGLIAYETTMLGAVLATLAGLLVELRLPSFSPRPYDPSVTDGGIVVAIPCSDQNRKSIEDVVQSAGAVKVNWMDVGVR